MSDVNSVKQLELENKLAQLTLKTLIEIENTHSKEIEASVDLFAEIDSELFKKRVPTSLGKIIGSLSSISRADNNSLHRLHYWEHLLENVLALNAPKLSTIVMVWKHWSFAFMQARESHEREEIKVRDASLQSLLNSLNVGILNTEDRHKTQGVEKK